MKFSTRIAAVALAGTALAVAGSTFAHPGGPGMGYGAGPGYGMGYGMGPGYGMGYGMGPGYGMHHGPGPGMWQGMGPGRWLGMGPQGPMTPDAAGARLDALKAELKITPAQETAWQAYAGVIQRQVQEHDALRTQMHEQMRSATSPADMTALRETMFKQREAHFATREAARKDLLAALTAEQKAVLDQRQGPFAGGRGGCAGRPTQPA